MDYQRLSKAADLSKPFERAIYRALEIMPGFFSWGTIIGLFILAFFEPAWVAFFIICFDLYWFFKSIYFSFFLNGGYRHMKKVEAENWMQKLEKDYNGKWSDLYHLIVLPMYKEPLHIVEESFDALLKCDYPKDKFIVVLACEEVAKNDVAQTVEIATKKYGDKFFKFLVTYHPQNLPNEIPGKASNETWAAKISQTQILDTLKIDYQKVIFSSFDIDTVVFPQYFSCLTYNFIKQKNPHRFSYQPVPLFTNNIEEASAISRVFSFSTSFWQMISQEKMEKLITFSSHSMSFYTLVDVGFKQTNIVSDDSRIFWQCFLKYDGDYAVCPLYYPVAMDAATAKNWWTTVLNIYKQQRRWAYGACDIAYFMFNFWKNNRIPLKKKVVMAWEVIEGHWAWACASFLIFAVGWFPLFFGGAKFKTTSLSFNLPQTTSNILTISMLGLVISAYYSVQMMPHSPQKKDSDVSPLIILLQWLLVPLVMVFFTSVPAFEAQTRLMLGKYMGFWVTPKMRKAKD